jgi:SAM-dependent methyltransferase
MPLDAAGPNAEQITYWNERSGAKWVAAQEELDRRIAPYGEAAMAALPLGAGVRVLDVGCGCGDTSLALARRVGETGSVLGVDISAPMLQRAEARARAAGAAQCRFLLADAQTAALEPASVDVVFSRFGVMFFADPVAAFANLARAARPGGALGFVCWQAAPANQWVSIPLAAAAAHVPLQPPPAPGAPGPFAFADQTHVRRTLERAGWEDVRIEPHTPAFPVGSDVDDAVRFLLQIGPAAAALRDAAPDAVARVRDTLREALRRFATADGVVLGSAAWLVRGRASTR